MVFSPRLLDRHFPENVEPYPKGCLQCPDSKAELSRAITHEMGTRVIAVNVRLLREKLHAELNVDALQERQRLEREKRLADPEWPPIRRSETRAETRKVKRAATSSRTLS